MKRFRVGIGFGFVLLSAGIGLSGCRPAPTPVVRQEVAANISRDPWVLETTSPAGHSGCYLGNGAIGMRVGPSGTTWSVQGRAPSATDEHRSMPLTCVAAGLWVNDRLAEPPNWGLLAFAINGRIILPEAGMVRHYRQKLDLRRGELVTQYTTANTTPRCSIRVETRVQRDHAEFATFIASLLSDRDGEVRVLFPLTGGRASDARTAGGGRKRSIRCSYESKSATPRSILTVTQYVSITGADSVQWGADATQSARCRIRGNRLFQVVKRVRVTMKEAPDSYANKPITELVARHRAAWNRLWSSDIQIEGDLEAQQAVRAAMFWLLCSARKYGAESIAPMGLSSHCWHGHIFWDADIWMLPVLDLLHPPLAAPLLEYRYRTLPGARANARAWGVAGADYAWESGCTGRELALVEFKHERHITADVGISQWEHYLRTGDRTWLALRGWPLLREIARCCSTRARLNPVTGKREIRRIIGPDESAGNWPDALVDNDIYTNASALYALLYAARAGRILGKPVPPEWERVARDMLLPYDPVRRIYRVHDRAGDYTNRPKQADAELLFFPLRHKAPADLRENTLHYYMGRYTPTGPAMTASIHTVVACQIARDKPAGHERNAWVNQAVGFFLDSYRPFMRPPFNDFSEKRSRMNSTFMTGGAGMISSVLYGFGGIEYDETGIRARPILPKRWTRLRITGIHYHNRVYVLDVRPGGFSWKLRPSNPESE
jgi:trehalose/maltose hydrolase-like predicted phosphorylase